MNGEDGMNQITWGESGDKRTEMGLKAGEGEERGKIEGENRTEENWWDEVRRKKHEGKERGEKEGEN